jgi:hypothetical protein
MMAAKGPEVENWNWQLNDKKDGIFPQDEPENNEPLT